MRIAEARSADGIQGAARNDASLLEKAHDLPQEQRIALGLIVQRFRQPGGRRSSPRPGDERLHLLGAQPGQIDPGEMRRPRQAAQGIGQRVLARQFGRSVGPDQQQIGCPPSSGARNSSRRSDGASAQCRSSSTRTQRSGAGTAGEELPDRFEHAKAGLGRDRPAGPTAPAPARDRGSPARCRQCRSPPRPTRRENRGRHRAARRG